MPKLRNAVLLSEISAGFEILPHEERVSLCPGDVAKICVAIEGVPERSGERFWVLITTAADGAYSGIVDNELEYTESHGLQFGDVVSFDYRHIYDAKRRPPQGWPRT